MNGKSVTALASKVPNLEDRTRVIDELLRRALRVSDPKNPVEVATALRLRYGAEAAKLDEETTGLPVTGTASGAYLLAAPSAPADSPGEREYRRVQGALETDLTFLVNAPANRDYSAELTGWRNAILRQFSDGTDAARTGPDPAQRQTAFLAVRTLGDYARVARLVGVLNLEMNPAFRRLARSIDNAVSVIRVLIGEALYDAGLGDGGVLLDVPLIDLRQRGDALVQALRVLTALDNDDADDYGAALASYGALLDEIDREGALELKVYLRESSLSLVLDSIFDDLSSAVQRSDAEALRQIGGTLPVRIAELRRLYEIAVRAIGKKRHSDDSKDHDDSAVNSSAVSRFIRALDLFIQPLSQPRAGARLVELAVPLAMAAGQTAQDSGATTLRDLVNARARLAYLADCFFARCKSYVAALPSQIQLDFVLYHVDRAIDLYADGQDYPGSGSKNHRTIVCGIIATTLATQISTFLSDSSTRDSSTTQGETLKEIVATLQKIGTTLPQREDPEPSFRVMKEMYLAEVTWGQSAELMAPRYLRGNPYGHTLARSALGLLEQSDPRGDSGLAAWAKKMGDSEPWDYQLSKFRTEPPEVTTLNEIASALSKMNQNIASGIRLVTDTDRAGREASSPPAGAADASGPGPATNEAARAVTPADSAALGSSSSSASVSSPAPTSPPASRPWPAPPPFRAGTSPQVLDDEDREAALFLLVLTTQALDELTHYLEHVTAGISELQARWKTWLRGIRDGEGIRDLELKPHAKARGWIEDSERRLRDVITGADPDLGRALDDLFDSPGGIPTETPAMNAQVHKHKTKLLHTLFPRVFALNPKP